MRERINEEKALGAPSFSWPMECSIDDHRMRAEIGRGEGADIERLVGMVWVARVWGFDIEGLVHAIVKFDGERGWRLDGIRNFVQ